MKFLVLGDFHGHFPKKFVNLIRKEKVDLVVSNGDYFPFYYRKLWFKHCYHKDVELWEIIGKEKYKQLVLKDLEIGEKAIQKLDKLNVPVITVFGNVDYTRRNDVFDLKRKGKRYWAWDQQDFFSKIIRKYKNIKRFDYSFFRYGDFVFIGASGGSSPGDAKSRAFKKSKKILDNLFRKFRKENRKGRVIFVSHNVPFNTRLDKITWKKAHKNVKGRHYGSKLIKKVIQKHQPILAIGGHIHESSGKDKIGRTIIINPGAAHEGKAEVVEMLDGRVGRIKFIK